MSYQSVRTRQIVDWGAAIRAGFIAGFFFLLANLVFMALSFGANGWVLIRQLASILLGEAILAPPAAFDAAATIVALLVHFALSVGYALLIAYVIHRGGMITGIRLCSPWSSSFASVVMIVQLATRSPSPPVQTSHSPANAIRPPSFSRMW